MDRVYFFHSIATLFYCIKQKESHSISYHIKHNYTMTILFHFHSHPYPISFHSLEANATLEFVRLISAPILSDEKATPALNPGFPFPTNGQYIRDIILIQTRRPRRNGQGSER